MIEPLSRLRRLVAPLLAVLLVASGVWLWWDASQRRAAEAAAAESVRSATESVVAMLSYRPETAEEQLTAARDRMTGRFLDDYTQLVTTVVIPEATAERVTARAEVVAAASVSADSDHAVVLAFVNQTRTVGAEKPVVLRSTARVSLDRVDGRWLIAGFDAI